jgi:hypothetical protein
MLLIMFNMHINFNHTTGELQNLHSLLLKTNENFATAEKVRQQVTTSFIF